MIFFLFAIQNMAWATHNRAGEITFRMLGGLQYEVKVVTYTKSSSPADRPLFEIDWGDGTSDSLVRIEKIQVGNTADDISRNTYLGVHTYPAPGSYIISLEDPNRNGNVLNIPSSVNVSFYIETMLLINPMLGKNNSPVLLEPPLAKGAVFQKFIHNPNAYDVDGDSLSYKLISCKGAGGVDIMGYVYPNAISNVPGTTITIDPITGDLVWLTPQKEGEYNVAIQVEEWRNGKLIGYVIRDMQITIDKTNNRPPVFNPLPDYCVLAGDKVNFDVIVKDPDRDFITLTASGGPFTVKSNPAQFIPPAQASDSVKGIFKWNTECSHVRAQPYQLVFKAVDNAYNFPLADMKPVMIKVVSPAPKNLTAAPAGNNISLAWNSTCPQAKGYDVYRRNGKYPGTITCPCTTGVPSISGYTKIATLKNFSDTSYVDTNDGKGLVHGIEYCYRVVAYFADGAESCASNEQCAKLMKDLPVITNVSIDSTSQTRGQVYVAWSKPSDLDTNQYKKPYTYLVYRSFDYLGSQFALIDSLTKGLDDTLYHDTLINTFNTPVSYKIALYSGSPRTYLGSSQTSSSVFMTITPTDKLMYITWKEEVSWVNNMYVVQRLNPLTQTYDSIGYSYTQTYVDSPLVNGVNYCYRIKSVGSYSASGFVNPIINYSQIRCGSPLDNIAPCPPSLVVLPSCPAHQNALSWADQKGVCSDDIVAYNIYYKPNLDSDYGLLQQVKKSGINTFLHDNLLVSIAGCYMLTAIDEAGNEGVSSESNCVDNCPQYVLPNIFTPNSDLKNDIFGPFPYAYIKDVDMKIYDRWGLLVFSTNNPDILWDGKNQDTKRDCSESVYYYVCKVHEIRLDGDKAGTVRKGFVHLIRGK